jgi:fumarate hydratase, class II
MEEEGCMSERKVRTERDGLGAVEVPCDALYGAQTQRAAINFQFSGIRFPRPFLAALGMIKGAAAAVNAELGLLDPHVAEAIAAAAKEVEDGLHDSQFPLDIIQTGSDTSTNMNANEVIASLATRLAGRDVHPNDHVNLGQSSNDVIPTAIRACATRELVENLLPGLAHLEDTLSAKAVAVEGIVKTGRMHLMDAVPLRMSQEVGGWAAQVRDAGARVKSTIPSMSALPIGGTAVGTGLNTHPEFGARVARRMAAATGLPFTVSPNYFASLSSQDAAVELSGQLRGVAVTLLKIANDLRWMNSGPAAGLGEITLAALQPGSSMMPGKVNPVIPEAVAMVCAQVIGNDAAILMAGASSEFQLNVMQPLVAWNLLSSIGLLSAATLTLADKAIAGFTVNKVRVADAVRKNQAIVTALALRIGYDRCAEIVRESLATGTTIEEVARETLGLNGEEVRRLLDPARMTHPGFPDREQ